MTRPSPEKLAAALRANLKRRKPPQDAEGEKRPHPDPAGADSATGAPARAAGPETGKN